MCASSAKASFCHFLAPPESTVPFKPNRLLLRYHLDESVIPFRGVRLILSQLYWRKLDFFKQTLKTPMRHRMMRCLIWVCTVCLCPIYRTLNLIGLINLLYNIPYGQRALACNKQHSAVLDLEFTICYKLWNATWKYDLIDYDYSWTSL